MNENFEYIEYKTSEEMYLALSNYLYDGYKIIDNAFLAIEIAKNDKHLLLSYIHIDDKNNIKNSLKSLYKEMELVYPDYDNTLLNVIGSIREYFGFDNKYNHIDIFDKKYDHIIFMVLDGLGSNILSNLDDDSFIKSIYKNDLISIYPSTTAAATTSLLSGLTPLESGWTGWENYIKEVNKNIVLFTGVDYYTDEYVGRSGYDFMPYKHFYDDLNIKTSYIMPDFSDKSFKFKKLLKNSLSCIKASQFQYVYYTEPDGIMHKTGTYSKQTKEVLKDIDDRLKKYVAKLPNNTILIISADHSHTPVEAINIYSFNYLFDMLKRKLSNDSRCITFSVKEDKYLEFEYVFNKCFGSIYKLYKSNEIKHFFGKGIEHERINDFLGDYVAIATNSYYFNYSNSSHIMKSHHAGITRDEMIIPLCIYRK